jgi:hypothetical protein
MKPMVSNSTPFISYHEINLKDVDLFEDAHGLSTEFCDVINLLRQIKAVPDRRLTEKLIEKFRKRS